MPSRITTCSGWLLGNLPFQKAYVATKKKGNCMKNSQNMNDLNQTGASATSGSLKVSVYQSVMSSS